VAKFSVPLHYIPSDRAVQALSGNIWDVRLTSYISPMSRRMRVSCRFRFTLKTVAYNRIIQSQSLANLGVHLGVSAQSIDN